jgi:hypothetical protein
VFPDAYLELVVTGSGSWIDFFPTPTPTPTPTAIPSTKRATAAIAIKNIRLFSPQIVSGLDDFLRGSGGGMLSAVSSATVELLPGLRGSGLPT